MREEYLDAISELEKALSPFHLESDGEWTNYEFNTSTIGVVIELLEKQIPISPLGFDNGGAENYEEWAECPECSESIPEYTLENETECYCLGCGQFLNWSDEE